MSRSRGRLRRAKETPRFSCGLPLMQCVLVKTASGATGNESESPECWFEDPSSNEIGPPRRVFFKKG